MIKEIKKIPAWCDQLVVVIFLVFVVRTQLGPAGIDFSRRAIRLLIPHAKLPAENIIWMWTVGVVLIAAVWGKSIFVRLAHVMGPADLPTQENFKTRLFKPRAHALALAWLAPAVLAIWGLRKAVPFSTMLFDGGSEVFRHNLCELLLMPYVALFMLALGCLLLPSPSAVVESEMTQQDLGVVRFFAGAGLLTLLGFFLGMAGLLYAAITIPIFIVVLYQHLLRAPSPLARFLEWITVSDAKDLKVRLAGLVCRVLICRLFMVFVIEKAIAIRLENDALQLYFPYFAETRLHHSIWLEHDLRMIFGFFVCRGHGVHLFLTSFTDQFFGQIISAIYFGSIAILVRRMVYRVVPSSWLDVRAVVPDCAVLIALTSPIAAMGANKFHIEIGALLMFLSWSSLLLVFTGPAQSKWLGWAMLPVALALPLETAQVQAASILILLVAAGATFLEKRRKESVLIHGLLALSGCVAAGLSLLLNQLYIGLAEVNPYQLFLKFANLTRLQEWSSLDLIYYASNSQGFEYVNSPKEVLRNFIVAISNLSHAGDFYLGSLSVSTTYIELTALLLVLLAIRSALASKLWLDVGAAVFMSGIYSVYAVFSLMESLSGHGSLHRLMGFLDAYAAIAFVFPLIMFGAFWPWRRKGAGALAIVGVCAASVAIAAFNTSTKRWVNDKRAPAYQYFYGAENLIGLYGRQENMVRFGFCGTLAKIIPAGESVQPLNSVFDVVPACAYSPLSPRGQVQDTLHYGFASEFGQVMLGDTPAAYAALKRHHVDYFFIQRGDLYFWGPGVTEHFSRDQLLSEFDLFYQDDHFFVLTWRGHGRSPVSEAVADEIDQLWEESRKAVPQYFEGLERLRRWKDSRVAGS
jgi:hypothetical protein